ncbi:diguanylate cyclase [Shewanella sp. YIC-542]|uniref:tetratricopeptide repeat-containing diguanylate cyclase n=1 Tax=Shewanella mytili TaxID=3377111 RepID=UPI00398EB778
MVINCSFFRCGIIVLLLLLGGGKLFAAPVDDIDISLEELENLLKRDVSAARLQIEMLTPQLASFTSEQAARLLIASAISHIFNGEFDNALQLLTRAETKASSYRYLIQIYNYRATCLIGLRRYQDALIEMNRNLNLLEKLDDPIEKRDAYLRVANLYDELEAYDEMGLYANRVLSLADEQQDSKARCYGIFLLSVSQNGRGRLKQAEAGLKHGLAYCTEHGYSLMSAMMNKALGDTARQLADYQSAQHYLHTALEQYQQFNFVTELVSTRALLAKVSLALGDHVQAEAMARQVLETEHSSHYFASRRDAFNVMAQLSANRADFASAYHYQQQYVALSSKLFNERRVKALAYQAAKFSTNEREQELKLLNKERELLLTREALREQEHNDMVMLASFLSIVIMLLTFFAYWGWQQKRKFMKLSLYDPLTGIFNRATAQRMADEQFVQAMSRDAAFSVILFDMDNFKQINDRFGYGCGDWALSRVVATVQPLLPRKHIFGRSGGEEFMVVMPHINALAALSLATALRRAIAEISSRHSGHQFVFNASFGVSSRTPDDLSVEPLLNRADKALQQAKSAGGNQVCSAPETRPAKADAE